MYSGSTPRQCHTDMPNAAPHAIPKIPCGRRPRVSGWAAAGGNGAAAARLQKGEGCGDVVVLAAVVVLTVVLADSAVVHGEVLRDAKGPKEQRHGEARLQINHTPTNISYGAIALDPDNQEQALNGQHIPIHDSIHPVALIFQMIDMCWISLS